MLWFRTAFLWTGCPPDGVAYAAAVSAWCAAGRPGEALRLVASQRARGVALEGGMFYDLLACLAGAGKMAQAEEIVGSLAQWGVAVKEGHFNALVKGCVSRRDLGAAAGVIEKMFNDAQNMELVANRGYSVLPTARTYGLLLDAHCTAGDVAAAQALLSEMRWRRVPPNVVLFNMMITAFGKAGRPDAGETILREMLGSGSWDMEALGVAPSAITFAAAADGWAALGHPERVRSLFARAASCNVALDEVCFGTLIKAYARARNPGAAQAVLLQDMPKAGVTPNLVCWSTAVSAWCTAGQPDTGEALLRSMGDVPGGVRPSAVTWNHVIFAHGTAGNISAASAALLRMATGDAACNLVPVPVGDSTRAAWDEGFKEAGLDPALIAKAWQRALSRLQGEAHAKQDGPPADVPAVHANGHAGDWRAELRVQAAVAKGDRMGSTKRLQNALVKEALAQSARPRGRVQRIAPAAACGRASVLRAPLQLQRRPAMAAVAVAAMRIALF